VVSRVLANRRMRRVEFAFFGFSCSEHGMWVAMLVYAYRQGGTSTAAFVAVAQLVPAAVVAPLASRLSDKRGGAFGLWVGYVAQAASLAATAALMFGDAPAIAVYAGGIVAASAVTLTRPAQAALLPTIVDTSTELTAANALTGWIESVSVLVGPALTGAAVGLVGPEAAVAVFAAALVVATILTTPLARRGALAPGVEPRDGDVDDDVTVVGALRAQPAAAALLVVFAAQFVVYGAFDILAVVLAIEVLHIGAAGGGYLTAAFGAGGIVGGAATLLLVGRQRLVPSLVIAGTVWGAAFGLIGLAPNTVGAFALMAAAGSARTLFDVAGRTLLHRATPLALRGRVFGLLEGLSMAAMATGSLLVPALGAFGGPRAAVTIVGGLLVVAALTIGTVLTRLDVPAGPNEAAVELVRGSELFGALAAPLVEELAASLVVERFSPGDVVVREGEAGDRYYLIASGTVAVSQAGQPRATLGPGDGFGEIALLHDTVRTATVTACEDATLYVLNRAPFLDAVAGPGSA
jgi:MFS family permease